MVKMIKWLDLIHLVLFGLITIGPNVTTWNSTNPNYNVHVLILFFGFGYVKKLRFLYRLYHILHHLPIISTIVLGSLLISSFIFFTKMRLSSLNHTFWYPFCIVFLVVVITAIVYALRESQWRILLLHAISRISSLWFQNTALNP